MKIKKLLSYLTMGVLFMGSVFAVTYDVDQTNCIAGDEKDFQLKQCSRN